MSRPPRRVPVPNQQKAYAAVPSSPRSASYNNAPQTSRTPSTRNHVHHAGGGAIAQGVASGSIGGGYGPYAYHPNTAQQQHAPPRFSNAASDASGHPLTERQPPPKTSTVPAFLWDTQDPEMDDALHNPDPVKDRKLDRQFTLFSARGWLNVIVLVVIVLALLTLFTGGPIISVYTRKQLPTTGFNLGGINKTGQIPDLPGLPQLIDQDTPSDAKTRTGSDGKKYHLVFSDEFNIDGRTFWPGDDPFWEAQDFHYWPTGDLEWYDPQAITTQDGKLVITMDMRNIHDLNFRSGMMTSWNKLCFTTGYVEVSISMPGSPKAPGLWPGAWTMGNLGKAGYGATTEGMWPYSYDSCDLGTFPNQTSKDNQPEAALTGSPGGGPLSFLPGQRLSACTCPGSDHPGPKTSMGRGVPEIDIIETQVDVSVFRGEVSQSFQTAPYNYQYKFFNDTPQTTIYDSSLTKMNSYTGGVFQQALSAVTYIDDVNYGGQGYAAYGYEWWSDPNHRDDGYITWTSQGKESWKITSGSLAADSMSQVSQRLIPEEPMYIVLNLGLSPSFQKQDFKNLQFPSKMYIDYVRVYQRDGVKDGVTCDPSSRPTAQYINDHINAYTNPNLTTWAKANYTFPRNSLYDGC